MTMPEIEEKLSALMDGELPDAEVAGVLGALRRDPALLGRWRRYQLAAAALRNELGGAADVTVVEAVRSRIEHEAPAARRRRPHWRPWAGGLALAASVAAVTVLGLDWWTAGPGSAGEVAQAGGGATRWEDGLSPQSEDVLNAYLVEHGEYTAASGMNGLSAYARFVSYDSAR